jgi:hypothetical protein
MCVLEGNAIPEEWTNMTREHLLHAVRTLAQRSPFVPLVLEFSNGTEFRIANPQSLEELKTGFAYRNREGRLTFFNAEDVCRVAEEDVLPDFDLDLHNDFDTN